MGGAVLNEIPTSDDPKTFSFAGSTIVIQASSREEVVEILKQDIYAKSGVWDVDNVSFTLRFSVFPLFVFALPVSCTFLPM